MALALTKGYQRAREEAVRCWGGGGAMAVAEEQRVRAIVGTGTGGCYGAEVALLRAKKKAEKEKWRARGVSGRTRGGNGQLWPGSAARGRATVDLIQFVTVKLAEPDDAFCNDENFVTNGFQRKLSTSKLQYNVPATIFIQGSCANSQQK